MHYLKLRLLPTNKNGTCRVFFKLRDEKFSYTDLDGEGECGDVKKVDR